MHQSEPEVVQSATLIISGGDFDPAEVTSMLSLRPNQAWRKGERKSLTLADGTKRLFDSVHELSGWKMWLDEPERSRSLSDQLEHWDELLRARSTELAQLRDRGASIVLDCCVITSTTAKVHTSPAIQAAFSDMGIHLDITFYAHDDPDGAA